MKIFADLIFVGVLSCVFFGANAWAEEDSSTVSASAATSTSETKLEKPADGTEKKDIDNEITNARMRAMSGKKARVSLYTDLTYGGGSIQKPFSKERPLLIPGQLIETRTKLSGTVSLRFRFSQQSSLSLGSGVGLTTPGFEGQTAQMENPTLSFSQVFRSGMTQNIFTLGMTHYTSKEIRLTQAMDALYLGHTMVVSMDQATKFNLGFTGFANYALYSQDDFLSDNSPKTRDVRSNPRGRTDITLAFFPFLEYQLSEKLTLRTSYTGTMYYHYRGDTQPTYYTVDPSHSLGLGISITRDVYLLPNIQWIWNDMRAEKTNVAVSANMSL